MRTRLVPGRQKIRHRRIHVGNTLILLSLSRLAFVTALVLWGIATLDPSHTRGRIRFLIAIIVATVTVYAAITYIKPLHDRFYQGEIVQVKTGVPGVAAFSVNLEGRRELWATTWDSYLQSPVLGHGAGASDDLITRTYGSGAGHPHDDYLRILNDYGSIGFAFWILGYLACLRATFRNWTRSLKFHHDESAYHCRPFSR